MIELHVPGKPIALPRQRHRIVKCKHGKMFVQSYTPARGPAAQWKRIIAKMARTMFDQPLDGPLQVSIEFVFQVKSKPQAWRIKTPDVDNLVKLILDALNGIAYHDDRQVAVLMAAKTESVESCGAIISIKELVLDDI